MPIKSYLAYPLDGKKAELVTAISQIHQCEVIPADNRDVLIVITQTNSREEEEHLSKQLEAIHSLKILTMVSGFDTPINK